MSQKSWACFLIAALGLTGQVVLNHGAALTSPPKLGENKCTTDDCIVERLITAARVVKYRDSAVDPCNNMYQFVCGNYDGTDISHNPSTDAEIRNALMNSFIGVVDAMTSDFRPFKMIEELHDVCIDDNARNPQSLELMKLMITHLGGWPMMEGDKWKEADFDWMNFSGESKKSGYAINYFVEFDSKLDTEGKEKILVFRAVPTSTDLEYLTTMKIEPDSYKVYMMTIAKLVGATGDISKDVDDVIEFEKKLHAIDKPSDDKADSVMGVSDLQKEFPGIDWNNWVSKTLTPFMDKGEEPAIAVWSVLGMKEFIKLMGETPKRVQANYAIWKLIQNSVSFLTPEFTKAQEEYWKIIGYDMISKETFCDETAKFYMEEAMKYFFIHQFKTSADSMQNMVQGIKDAMVVMVKDSKKLDAADKEKGSKVISEMPVTLGSSSRFSDPKELETLYAETEIDKTNFLQTLMNVNMFRITVDYSRKLKKDLNFVMDQPESLESPRNIDDHLFIPVEMLDSPMFDNNRPMYMNYGAAGPHMGREMFNSVDELSKKEVSTEQMKCFENLFGNVSDSETKEKFKISSISVFIDQYMGLRTAYKAYKDYEAENGAEAPLPEVSHTVEQLFWMAYMGQFCQWDPEIKAGEGVEGTDMKMLEFIMQKVMSQVPEVAADFSCPAGSMMNPETRCDWW